jgi:parvulin-like peptidyl-prolyl isomerase
LKASKRSKKRPPAKKKMRRRNVVVLWLVAIGLLVSMVISFTPTMGNFGNQHALNEPAFFVNGEPIMELDVNRSRQGQLFTITEGEVAEDAELLLLAQLIDNEVLRQAAEDTRVSRGEVSEAIRDYREARGVLGGTNDTQYLQLIANQGFTDQAFRDFQREQIRQRKFIDSLVEDIEVTDDEVRDFYEANKFNYLSDPQLIARQIVVDDEELANTLLVRIARGEDFETLATEYSLELADVAGAINADDDGNPQPIGRIGLPTSVASAALGLEGRGTTDVISTGGQYYIVRVEDYLAPDVQAFEDIETELREATLAAKETALLQDALEQLRNEAELEFPPESDYDFTNEVVATVGDRDIYELDLAEATYLNQQVQQFLSPDTADTVASFFKPTFLEQLIEQNLALHGAETLDANFVGTDALVASSALNYIASDIDLTEADLEEYYQTNLARFTIPASATVVQLDFADQDAAQNFRATILDENLDFSTLAERARNEELIYNDLGNVTPGQLESELDRYLFGTEAFEPINDESLLEVSDVVVIETEVDVPVVSDPADDGSTDGSTDDLALGDDASAVDTDSTGEDSAEADTETAEADAPADNDLADDDLTDEAESADSAESVAPETETITETTYTLLVAIRMPERVRSLDDVRSQVEEAVLATQRSELQQNWLTALRETVPVENLIAEEPATMTPATPSVEFTTEPVEETPEATPEEATLEEVTSEEDGTSDAEPDTDGEINASDEATDPADITENTLNEVSDTSEGTASEGTSDTATSEPIDTEVAEDTEDGANDEAEASDEAASDEAASDEAASDDDISTDDTSPDESSSTTGDDTSSEDTEPDSDDSA